MLRQHKIYCALNTVPFFSMYILCTHVSRTAFDKELFESSKTESHCCRPCTPFNIVYKAKAFKGLPNVQGREEMQVITYRVRAYVSGLSNVHIWVSFA